MSAVFPTSQVAAKAIFISNLPLDTTSEALEEVFSFCGNMTETKIRPSPSDLQPKTAQAIIVFETKDSRDTAMLLNETSIGGYSVNIMACPDDWDNIPDDHPAASTCTPTSISSQIQSSNNTTNTLSASQANGGSVVQNQTRPWYESFFDSIEAQIVKTGDAFAKLEQNPPNFDPKAFLDSAIATARSAGNKMESSFRNLESEDAVPDVNPEVILQKAKDLGLSAKSSSAEALAKIKQAFQAQKESIQASEQSRALSTKWSQIDQTYKITETSQQSLMATKELAASAQFQLKKMDTEYGVSEKASQVSQSVKGAIDKTWQQAMQNENFSNGVNEITAGFTELFIAASQTFGFPQNITPISAQGYQVDQDPQLPDVVPSETLVEDTTSAQDTLLTKDQTPVNTST